MEVCGLEFLRLGDGLRSGTHKAHGRTDMGLTMSVMSFVNAVPLALIIALPLIPLLLHLLTLHRLRTIELSTYRFLFDSYVQQRRRTRFFEAFLALLRMLFILGLIALIARPVTN